MTQRLDDGQVATPPTTGDTGVRRQRQQAGHSRDLDALLRRRPDLAGVHRAADVAHESVRWSA